eukprot:TRINITY_DN65419_c4_g1_i2.p1 TRINITY_DN65419_c4_g1~~TRINITY_DN65419_c4_g1_i2.p1  ORF type:complete len:390 (-),score=123.95 TRINITY_DN65419_c4_g1_i2:144-1313(-)
MVEAQQKALGRDAGPRRRLPVSEAIVLSPVERINSAIDAMVRVMTEIERKEKLDSKLSRWIKEYKGKPYSSGMPRQMGREPIRLAEKADAFVAKEHLPELPLYDDLIAQSEPFERAREEALQMMSRQYRVTLRGRAPNREKYNAVTPTTLKRRDEELLRAAGGRVEPLAPDEALYRVAVFHPVEHYVQEELLLLGSQPLTALRDAIQCLENDRTPAPHSHAAMLYIENKFFDDDRHADAPRYSKAILDWIREGERYRQAGLQSSTAESMSQTKFDDLSIRLGSHYLYQHCGNCQHIVVFTELRIRSPADADNAVLYPRRVYRARPNRIVCAVCDLFPASLVTTQDTMLPNSPSYWCQQCFDMFHFTETGDVSPAYTTGGHWFEVHEFKQ